MSNPRYSIRKHFYALLEFLSVPGSLLRSHLNSSFPFSLLLLFTAGAFEFLIVYPHSSEAFGRCTNSSSASGKTSLDKFCYCCEKYLLPSQILLFSDIGA